MHRDDRSGQQTLLQELGLQARLTVYLAGAAGAGKTHRLLCDAALQASAGRRIAIGWIETKGRPDLDALAAPLPRIPPRRFITEHGSFEDFDLEAALAADAELIVLDELAHSNPPGAPNAKRWQDALALRRAGRSVLGALNVQHLETVAPSAERIVGHPIGETVPISFLKEADNVIALDVSPSVLESRLRTGRIVQEGDVERAASGAFRPANLMLLRELLLRTVDDLTIPVLSPSKTSTALAIVTPGIDPNLYLQRVARVADALDLALETTALPGVDAQQLTDASLAAEAGRIPPPAGIERGRLDAVKASFVAVPPGELALRVLQHPLERMLYVSDPARPALARRIDTGRHPYAHVAGDRMRIGYGKITVYFGAVPGSGVTYDMLERGRQLRDDGVDVVVGLIESNHRAETAAKVAGLEALPPARNGELDVEGVLKRRPGVVLIDDLAHTNAAGSAHEKRYDDVLSILREGIDVMTTLNVLHLEGVGEAVERLTGTRVRETLPDAILDLADDIVFVDASPQILRERLRSGKIYPLERIDRTMANFFAGERLAALRELAIREVTHARGRRRGILPFDRILLGVAPRLRDAALIERMGSLASRLDVDLRVVLVASPAQPPSDALVEALTATARRAKGSFAVEHGTDPPAKLVALAQPLDVLAVESLRVPRRFFTPPSFALRLLKAGARELLVLRPAPAS